jgi:hypothetical protein
MRQDKPESLRRHESDIGTVDDAGRQGRLSWLYSIPPEVPVFLFYLALTLFLTWPLIAHMNTSFYGFSGDQAGTAWFSWWYKHASAFGGTTTFSPIIGFPFGSRLGFPIEPLNFLVMRFMLLFFNEIIVSNLYVLGSFFLSGVTMYYLVRYVARDRKIAAFGGLAYILSVYHAFYSMFISGAVSSVQWMPLYILLLLKFIKSPTVKNGVLLAIGGVVVAGFSIHFGFFMAVFTLAFLVGRYIYKRIVAARDGTGIPWRRAFSRKTALISLAVAMVVVLAVLPAFYLYTTSTAKTGKWPTSPTPDVVRTDELVTGNAATPGEYLVPSVLNPFFGSISRKFKHNLFPDFGNAVYLGWTLIFLALVYAVFGWKRRRKRPPDDTDEGGGEADSTAVVDGRRELTATVVGFTTAMVVAFVLSVKPYWTIGSIRIPLPSRLVELVAPWFRWYSRFGVVVFLCLVVIASLGLQRLIGWLRYRSLKYVVPLILVVLMFMELILVPPFRQYSFAETPPVFEAVKASQDTGGWVFYPLTESGPFVNSSLRFWQRVFGKPMLNGAAPNSDGEALRRTVHSPYNKATPGILARFGLTNVVFFGEPVEGVQGQGQDASLLPAGYKQIASFKGSKQFRNAHIYRVTAKPAEIVPLYLGDISVPYLELGGGDIMLSNGKGVIRLVSYARQDRFVDIKLPIRNPLSRREVSLETVGGKVLWRGVLASGQETTAEIDGLNVRPTGTDIKIKVVGPSNPVNLIMTVNFGVTKTSIAIGDAEIVPVR